MNHNQTVAHGLEAKTNVKASDAPMQHKQPATRGLKVKTGIKAGPPPTSTGGAGPGTGL